MLNFLISKRYLPINFRTFLKSLKLLITAFKLIKMNCYEYTFNQQLQQRFLLQLRAIQKI